MNKHFFPFDLLKIKIKYTISSRNRTYTFAEPLQAVPKKFVTDSNTEMLSKLCDQPGHIVHHSLALVSLSSMFCC